MAEEQIIYDQVETGGDPDDPLGLRRQLKNAKQPAKAASDPLGLRAKLSTSNSPAQPEFQIKLSEPAFGQSSSSLTQPEGTIVQESAALPNVKSKSFSFDKPVDALGVEKMKGKAAVSHSKLKTELLSNDVQYEKNVREYRRDNYTVEDLKDEYSKNGWVIPVESELPNILAKAKERQYKLAVTPQDITDIKTGTILDEKSTRQFIKNMKRPDVLQDLYTVDKFNEIAGDPNGQYRIEKVKDIAKKIGKGELLYDPESKRAIKPLGLLGSIIEGTINKFKGEEEHDFFKNAPDASIVKELEDERNNPTDEPLKVPKGKAQEFIMGLAEMPLSPLFAGAAGGIAGPAAAMVAGAAVGAYENRKIQYRTTFKQVYNELRDQGVSENEALQTARRQAEHAQEIGTLVGAGQGILGAKIGATPLKGTSFSPSYQKAIGTLLKQNAGELGKIALEGIGQGAIGATGEIWKNKLAQSIGIKRDIDAGTADQFWGNLLMTAGIGATIKAGRGLTKANYRNILHGISKLPEEQISSVIQEKVSNGEITEAAGNEALNRINEYKAVDAQIPPNVTEEARFKIQDNIEKLNELEQQKEATHKSLQEPIKEKIQKLTENNLALSKEVEKPVKPESGLTKSQEKEAIETAEEFAAEGVLPDVYNEMVKQDPIGFWKMVAQQAQNRDENWKPLTQALDEQAVRDQFGDTVVEYAKELFPAPAVPESTVSVIMPGEIKQPETVTIKPQTVAAEAVAEGAGPEGVSPNAESAEQVEGVTPASQEGGSEPPLPPTEAAGIYAERPGTQLSFRGLQDTANEFGFEDVRPRDTKSDLQTRVNAEQTATEWAEKGEYQSNIDDMLGKIDRKEMVPTDEQRLILEQYIENEKQRAREIPDKSSSEYNRQLDKVRRLKEIGEKARSEAGAALRLPDGGSRPHPINDEIDAMVAKMEANSVDKLTDQQKAEVEAQVNKYKQASDEANAKIAALEEKVANIDSEKEFKKAKSTTKRTKKTTEERIAYRKSEIEAAREALKKLRSGESGLSAVPLPGVRELMAIAPHVKNIMVDLVAQGIDNLQDVVKHLHGEFKDVLDGITEKDIHDVIAGVYNEKTKPLSELQRQVKDIQDEAKLINQLEGLVNGKEPKAEKAKRERNRKIKDLKDKIKDFRQEEADSNKFYGESDAGERKLDKLRDELERIQNRRQKESPAKGSETDKEISAREQDLRDQIEKAQTEWDKEKESAKQAKTDYKRLEAERNRQLQKVDDLKAKLDQLEKGVKPSSKPTSKKTDTPEIEALKKRVADAEGELNKTLATEKRIKGLEDELDRLQQRKDKDHKDVNSREVTDREIELKEQIEEERKAIRKEEAEANKFYKEELDEDAKKLIAIKKRNQKREQEIKAKIAAGQFDDETKKSIFDREDIKKNYPNLRKDALDAIAKKEEAQHEFDLALFNDEMAQRGWFTKKADFLGKVLHTSKAIMSGIDDSATFVQNGLAMMANPKIGAKVWLNHLRDAFSDARFKRELAALHADPDFEVIQKSGLDVVEPHNAASEKVEEAFEKNLLAGKIKVGDKEFQPWKYTGGIFERAFTSMGNNMRVALFKKQIQALKDAGKTYESHPQEYEDAARVINELTGRGKLPQGLAQASPYFTPFIWAPRMLTSTINVLGLSDLVLGAAGKGYYQNLTPTQWKFARNQLMRGVGMGVGVMAAAALGGARVDYDPRSVTFGDVIIGEHHYNVFGRYTPVVKALVQVATGERVKKDGVQDLDTGKRGAKTRMGVVGGFFRGKMTPAAGAFYDLAEGKNYFTNEPFTVKDLPAALVTPMSVKELIEGWKNDGTWTLLNRFLPAFEGLKVSDERDFQKKSSSGSKSGKATKQTKTTKATKQTK